jgi:hypothetical protein
MNSLEKANREGLGARKLEPSRLRLHSLFDRNKPVESGQASPSILCDSPPPQAPFQVTLPPVLETTSSEESNFTLDGPSEAKPGRKRRKSSFSSNSSKLSHQLSRKISTYFSPSTVVHRPNLRRQNVPTGSSETANASLPEDQGLDGPSSPMETASSFLSSNSNTGSPFSVLSTAPTSITNDTSSRSVDRKPRKQCPVQRLLNLGGDPAEVSTLACSIQAEIEPD